MVYPFGIPAICIACTDAENFFVAFENPGRETVSCSRKIFIYHRH